MARLQRLADVAAKRFSEGMQPILTAFVFAGLDSSQVNQVVSRMLADYAIHETDIKEHRLQMLEEMFAEAKSIVRNTEDRI